MNKYLLNPRIQIGLATCIAILCLAFVGKREFQTMIFLPGTQPGQADTASSVSDCQPCHPDQVREWSGSMMAHSPKDPLFNAMLSITTKRMMGLGLDVGEYCLRCHSPSGWLAGRSHPQTVQDMYGTDLDGVHCDGCHRMTNPLANDGSAIIGDTVPGIGNGMYAVQRYQQPLRGSRGVPHPYGVTTPDSFFKSSEFCGVCHEVSNPYFSPNARRTPPHAQVMMERTYSEWKLSWFATRGEAGTCQSCHMKRSPGRVSTFPGAPQRLDVASHAFSGGNTFAPRSVRNRWNSVNPEMIENGLHQAKRILNESLKLEIAAEQKGDSTVARVRIVNLTGHKLPTGFPEGRRMWIQITGRDRNGTIMFESGNYDTIQRTIIQDPQLKIYHTEPGITTALASWAGVPAGPSYFTPLNDTIYYDNRIPPRGFQLSSFTLHRAEPVGYHYEDGQYWDETVYRMDADIENIEVIVWYQVASKEFIEFVRAENQENSYDWNSWGEKVYEDWLLFGQPISMATIKEKVADLPVTLPVFEDFEMPTEVLLAQNYPNPFNPGTTIDFWISQPTFVILGLYDITGREIRLFMSEERSAGSHRVYFNASDIPSGMYFYRIQAAGSIIIKKLLVLK